MIRRFKRNTALGLLRGAYRAAAWAPVCRSDDDRSAAILPAAPCGSLGDEAMLYALVGQLRARGFDRLHLLTYGHLDRWPSPEGIDSQTPIPTLRCGGWRSLHSVLQASSYFFLTGADVLDGAYSLERSLVRLEVVRLAARLGLDTSILGCSFSDHPHPATVRSIRNLPHTVRIFARDPFSQQRLSAFRDCHVILAADLAFLLKPEPAHVPPYVQRWIARHRANGATLVGINFNPHTLPRGIDATLGARDFVRILLEHDPSIRVVFLSHDYRSTRNDMSLARDINALLGDDATKCYIIHEHLSAAATKALVTSFDFILTGRMHLAIGALGQGVPTATVDYQGKVVGLYAHYSLPEFVVPRHYLVRPRELCAHIWPLFQNRDRYALQIKDRLPVVQKLAHINFESLGVLSEHEGA